MNRYRLAAILLTAGLASGCETLDCTAREAYQDARLQPPIDAPADLAEPAQSGTYAIPGTPPAPGYGGGPCLVRPPKTVEPPADGG